MKASKYNYIFRYDDENYIFYNSFSNAMALVENESYKQYKNYIEKNIEIDDKEFEEGLLDANYLIKKEFDEKKSIKLSMLKHRFDRSALSLIIAPTTDCNFRCTYCYEKNSNKELRMSPLIQERIIDFCEDSIKGGVKEVSILWYGGEPLLTYDIVKDMSARLIEICDKNKVQYSAGMITNGYSLNQKVCDHLKDCRINNIQVTLDGPRDIHNDRRFLLNGNPTFDKIVENIKEACKKYHITIRINVDKENEEGLDELLNVIEENGLSKKVDVYLGFVEDNNECYTKGSCMTKKGFSKSEFDFIDKMFERGITKQNPWLNKYPNLVTVQCAADHIGGLVISPEGNLYKCCCDIGVEEEEIGNIMKIDEIEYNNSLFNYLLYDPTEDEHCKDCKILPICMGGCFKSRDGGGDQRCSILKYNLKEYLMQNANILNAR